MTTLVVAAASVFVSSASVQAQEPTKCAELAPLEVAIDVPHPGWKLKIASVHRKGEGLLLVCRVKSAGGAHAMMIAKAKDSVKVDAALVGLPREVYVLGQTWRWSKGYKPVKEEELKKILEGSQPVYRADAGATSPAKGGKKGKPEAAQFVGMKLKDAQTLADQHKIPHRVVSVDGEGMMVTSDYRPERLNFTVVAGKVTAVTKG